MFGSRIYTTRSSRPPALLNRTANKLAAGAALAPLVPTGVLANDNVREVGDIPASGLIFKDQIKVNAFEDPKVC